MGYEEQTRFLESSGDYRMIVRRLNEVDEIVALDESIVRELLNPNHEPVKLKLNYSLAHATVKSGLSTLPHRFHEASEVYYILKGTGLMHIDNESHKVSPGAMIYIPPKGVQYIENTGSTDLEFLCIVNPAWFPEAEEVV